MIQVDNIKEGHIRFITKKPMEIEIVTIDGKMFVHSEPLIAKSSNQSKLLNKNSHNIEEDNLSLKEAK